jgi:hypothetical protein
VCVALTAGLWRSNYETRVCECLWLENYRGVPTTPCTTGVRLALPKTQIKGTGNFVNFVNDQDILMTDRVNYRCGNMTTSFWAPFSNTRYNKWRSFAETGSGQTY